MGYFDMEIKWTGYISYRAKLRGFDLEKIEEIIKNSKELYYDSSTDRRVAVGRHREQLVMIPYEENQGTIIPVTIHATTRRQIKYRIKVGRFINA